MKFTSCMLSDCPNDVRARGACAKHYKVWQRHGNAAHLPKVEADATPSTWQRFGADGEWTTELDESDRLALVGASGVDATQKTPGSIEGLDETNSRICLGCYRQVAVGLFAEDSTRRCGLARNCTPCADRKGLGRREEWRAEELTALAA